jgi:isopenicillin N synthase-like dioxygenase
LPYRVPAVTDVPASLELNMQDFDTRARTGAPQRTALTDLPFIDIAPFLRESAPGERMRTARALRAACIDIGFFYLTGHAFGAEELDGVLAQGLRFFSLPLAEKMKVARFDTDGQGFVRTGGIDPQSNPDRTVDIKERFYASRELAPDEPARGRFSAGRSRWPASEIVPGFEATMKAYIVRLLGLTTALGRAFALSLDLAEDYFDPYYRHPGITLALNYYPPLDPAALKPTQWSFSPHTDFGTFTILLQDDRGGLQARNSSGDWIDVPPRAGTFVINVGDLLARWTNDLYVSTLHRGVNVGTVPRTSAAFFVSPHGATVVRCLETCQGPDNPPRYEPVESEEYTRTLIAQSNKGRPGISRETAQRLRSG